MNKKFLLPFFVLAAILTLSSCSNKLKPLAEQYIKAEPQPLEAIGGKVPVTINATFPAKWFNMLWLYWFGTLLLTVFSFLHLPR